MDHPAVAQIRILLPPCNRSVCLWWIARRFLLVLILLVSPHLFIASTIRPFIKPGAAGNRFGYYVSVDCAMFQSAQVIQVHKNSPDLLFKSPSLLIYRGKGSARTPNGRGHKKGKTIQRLGRRLRLSTIPDQILKADRSSFFTMPRES